MLVIHIGTHKTGTSALQTFLARATDELLAKGVRYLQSGRGAGKAHHELAWAVRGRHGANLSGWTAVREELAQSTYPTNVLSSEGFWFCDPADVKAQLDGVKDVRIVMYLRRQDKYLQSLYKQTVTGGRKLDFETWHERLQVRGDYYAVVQKWADHFGADAIIIRPYERSGTTVNSVEDFGGLLGLDIVNDFELKRNTRRNPSPRRELLDFIRAFNQLDLDVDRDKFFYALIRRNESYIRSGDLLSYEQCAELLSSYAEGNRELVARYYRETEVPLFPELVAFAPPIVWQPGQNEYVTLMADVLDVAIQFASEEGIKRKAPGARKKSRLDNK